MFTTCVSVWGVDIGFLMKERSLRSLSRQNLSRKPTSPIKLLSKKGQSQGYQNSNYWSNSQSLSYNFFKIAYSARKIRDMPEHPKKNILKLN